MTKYSLREIQILEFFVLIKKLHPKITYSEIAFKFAEYTGIKKSTNAIRQKMISISENMDFTKTITEEELTQRFSECPEEMFKLYNDQFFANLIPIYEKNEEDQTDIMGKEENKSDQEELDKGEEEIVIECDKTHECHGEVGEPVKIASLGIMVLIVVLVILGFIDIVKTLITFLFGV